LDDDQMPNYDKIKGTKFELIIKNLFRS
jgi:hypothetical protein